MLLLPLAPGALVRQGARPGVWGRQRGLGLGGRWQSKRLFSPPPHLAESREVFFFLKRQRQQKQQLMATCSTASPQLQPQPPMLPPAPSLAPCLIPTRQTKRQQTAVFPTAPANSLTVPKKYFLQEAAVANQATQELGIRWEGRWEFGAAVVGLGEEVEQEAVSGFICHHCLLL